MAAAAVIHVRAAMLLPFLTVAVLSEAGPHESLVVETALASDDQCVAGAAGCALQALQRRGAALAEEAEVDQAGSRRRHASSGNDLSRSGEKKMKTQIKKTVKEIKGCEKSLQQLDKYVNTTWRILMAQDGDAGDSDEEKSAEEKPDDKKSDEQKSDDEKSDDEMSDEDDDADEDEDAEPSWLEADAEVSSTSLRRRRSKPPPRLHSVQHMVDICQAVMNKFWKNATRVDRLTEWLKTKSQNPNTPDWEYDDEEGDDDDDEDDEDEDDSLLELGEDAEATQHREKFAELDNPIDANMQRIVDDLDREVDGAKKELKRMKANAEKARKLAEQTK